MRIYNANPIGKENVTLDMNQFAGPDLLASSVIILDPEARIVYANPAAENLLERPSKVLQKPRLERAFS